MNTIPTAKEFFKEELSGEPLTEESVIEGLITFTKLHLQAQQEAILKNVKIKGLEIDFEPKGSEENMKIIAGEVDKDSTTSAYNINEQVI